MKASADSWCLFDRLREDIHQRACRFWCDRTGMEHTYFPLSVDGVARLYFRIRKRQKDEIAAFNEEVEQACAKASNGHHRSLFDED